MERSTLADWVGAAAHLLDPLINALSRHVLGAAKLHADDTPVPVLQPGRGTTKTGRLWTYVRDDRPVGDATPPGVWFQYSPDRKVMRPAEHLKRFTGILQADGYAGFNQLYATGRVTEAACWAHVRRKFYDLHRATDSPLAAQALERIRALYAIESQIRGRPPARRARACTRGARWTAPCGSARVAASHSHEGIHQERVGGGDPLCAHALDGAYPLRCRRAHRDRQ